MYLGTVSGAQNRWSWCSSWKTNMCRKITISFLRSDHWPMLGIHFHKLLNSIIVIAYCSACALFVARAYVYICELCCSASSSSSSISFCTLLLFQFNIFHRFLCLLSKIFWLDWAWSTKIVFFLLHWTREWVERTDEKTTRMEECKRFHISLLGKLPDSIQQKTGKMNCFCYALYYCRLL